MIDRHAGQSVRTLALGFAVAALTFWGASASADQGKSATRSAQKISVAPTPVGAARQFVATRAADASMPEVLPLADMVTPPSHPPVGDSDVTTRGSWGIKAPSLPKPIRIGAPSFPSRYPVVRPAFVSQQVHVASQAACDRTKGRVGKNATPPAELGRSQSAACSCKPHTTSRDAVSRPVVESQVRFMAAAQGMRDTKGFCSATCKNLTKKWTSNACWVSWTADPASWKGTIGWEEAKLAVLLKDGTLQLNTGRFANQRGGSNARDGSEQFTLRARGQIVVIENASVDGSTLGPLPQRFTGVKRINVDLGAGDDLLDLSNVDESRIGLSVALGAGNDYVVEPDPAKIQSDPSGASWLEGGADAAQTMYELFGNAGAPDIMDLRQERIAREAQFKAKLEEMQARAKVIEGPSALGAINLLEALHVDPGVQIYQSDILDLHYEIYPDANPLTGRFYYLPKRYDLAWDADNQYGMTVIYGLTDQTDAEGEVYMAARLESGVDSREIQAAQTLISAYIQRHSTAENPIRFRGLFPLPLEATTDIELFGGASNEFTVPRDKLSVQGVSGLLGQLDVSWAMDVRRVLNLESLLRTDAGIHGTVTFKAAGKEDFQRAIPLEIGVASPNTFRRIPFDRTTGWTNETFYPVQLKQLHALLLNPTDQGVVRKHDPIVYTWDLGEARVEPGDHVDWDAANLPPWLETSATVLWATYSVESDCESCDDQVFTEKFIPSLPSTRELVFTTGDPFESTGAYRISVHIRSPFFDPKRARIIEQPAVILTEDDTEMKIAKLYLTDRELTGEGMNEPLYEYRLVVSMRDGTAYETPGWLPSRELDFLLGSTVIEQQIGKLPGAQGE